MTGYTVHTGSNEKFTSGWDRAFAGKSAGKKKPAAKKGAATGRSSRKKKNK